jgi:hypothetical protein
LPKPQGQMAPQSFGFPHPDIAKPRPSACWWYVSARGFNPLACPLLVSRCSSLFLQPCAIPDPLLLQPQVLGKKGAPDPWEGKSSVDGKSTEGLGGVARWGFKGTGAEGAPVPAGGDVVSQPLPPLSLTPCASQVPYDQVSQASVSASLEWQRKLEAAEALLALKNSSQAPPNSISLHQPLNPPGSLLLARLTRVGMLGDG